MSRVAFSPTFIWTTPSSQPLMTWPTPMAVTKSPRPTELSNLLRRARLAIGHGNIVGGQTAALQLIPWATCNVYARCGVRDVQAGCAGFGRFHILGALVLRLIGVLEVASVLNGNTVADLGGGTGALLVRCLGNTHVKSGRVEEAGVATEEEALISWSCQEGAG